MEAFEQRKNREQNLKYNKQLAVMKKESKNKEKDQLMEEIEGLKDQAKECGADKTYSDKDAPISRSWRRFSTLATATIASSPNSQRRGKSWTRSMVTLNETRSAQNSTTPSKSLLGF